MINKLKFFATMLTCILLSINQVWSAVTPLTLPKTWASSDGSSAYIASVGCSKSVGSDYSTDGVKLKFNSNSTYLIIQLAGAPDKLGYKIKGNPSSGSSLTGISFIVDESSDGSTYTTVKSYSSLSNSITTESNLQLLSSTRFIRFRYVTKGNGNVGLGTVSISAGSSKTCVLFNHTFRLTTVYHSVV